MSQGYVDVQKKDDRYIISLVGPLDEEMSFKKVQLGEAKEIVINFENVKGIKSFGIRELMRWLSSYKTSKIIYARCPKIVVDQINIVDGFLPRNAVVESFFVPYYSEVSGEEAQILFRSGIEFNGSNITPPGDILDSQGNRMEMDVIWVKYFRFLESKERSRAS